MGLLAYAQRWAGGFADSNAGKPVDAQFLNAVETALLGLLGAAPTDGQAYVYDNALGRFKTVLLTNAHIDPSAAIAKSKLASLGIVDADIAAGAAIAASKLAGNIPASKLSSYPGDATKLLRGDGSWAGLAPYRKSTATQVSNSVAETDLLNGEITVAANALGGTGILRLTAWGSILNNTGASQQAPRWKLKFGGTTVLDTNVIASALATSANAAGWRIDVLIGNLGATNSQECSMRGAWVGGIGTGGAAFFTTGSGAYVAPTGTGGLASIAFTGRNPSAVDTTVACPVALSVTLGAASANFAVSLTGAVVEIL